MDVSEVKSYRIAADVLAMPDNSYSSLNATGSLLEACVAMRRCTLGQGISSDGAMRMLSDLSFAGELIDLVIGDVQAIAGENLSAWSLPTTKVERAVQDMQEVRSALRLLQSAAFNASRALTAELDAGIPKATSPAPAVEAPPQGRTKAATK